MSARGIAACWVVIAHLLWNPIYDAGFAQHTDAGWLAYPIRFDFFAVDFFFVLSGCMLTLKYRSLFEKKTTGGKTIDRFLLLRLARIYPLHLFTLALLWVMANCGIALTHSAPHWEKLWEHLPISLLNNLSLTHAWGIIPSGAWNEPAWTISIMALLYVCFPNLIYAARRFPDRARATCIAIATLIALYALQRHVLPLGSHSDGAGAIMRGFVFFIIGILTARLHSLGWKSHLPWRHILHATLAIGLVMIVLWLQHPFTLAAFHALYPIALLALLNIQGPHWLRHRSFGWLGTHAFALYMLHYPVLLALKHIAGADLHTLATTSLIGKITAYLLTLITLGILSTLAHRFIERPTQRYAQSRIHLNDGAAKS